MIELQLLNKEKLFKFIQSEAYKTMPVLPISFHRAVSHIHNPRAHENDILLILAYENNYLLGYLGILPDDIHCDKDNLFHAGWLSCIWVSPTARGKGIAKKMVLAAYEAYHHHILITNFTDDALALYERLRIFKRLPDLEGFRIYRTACLSKVLPKRFQAFQKFRTFLQIADVCINAVWKLFLKTKADTRFDFLPYKSEDFDTIKYSVSLPGFYRTSKEFQWIVSYPWIKRVDELSDEARRYHFSSEEKNFEATFVKIVFNKKQIGSLYFILRDGHLRIPYVFVNDDDKKILSAAINQLIIQKQPEYITLFLSNEVVQNLTINYLFKKKTIRRFMITAELHDKLEKIGCSSLTIFDGDGDASFT